MEQVRKECDHEMGVVKPQADGFVGAHAGAHKTSRSWLAHGVHAHSTDFQQKRDCSQSTIF